MPEPMPVPAGFGIRLQPDTRWLSSDVVVGGSPPVAVRLSPRVAADVRALAEGAPVTPATAMTARHLLDADMALPEPHDAIGVADVAVVIPARNAAASLPRLVESLPPGVAEIVVSDDHSSDATPVVARRLGARVVRVDGHGPAAARNAALCGVSAPFVLLVDADTVLGDGAVARLAAHLADPAVAVAAPRVTAFASIGPLVVRYEAARSPLDVGPRSGRVRRGARVAFVPAAAMLVRRDALTAVGGFDAALQAGEDTDLCWRLDDAGWTVRYDADAVVRHDHRATLGEMLRRRADYGRPIAALERRHPGGFRALTLSAALAPRAVLGNLRSTLFAVTRTWLPAMLVLALVSRQARRAVAVALLVRHLADWPRRAHIGPARWVGMRIADDLAFAAGVWEGALTERDPWPLLVRIQRGRRVLTDFQ